MEKVGGKYLLFSDEGLIYVQMFFGLPVNGKPNMVRGKRKKEPTTQTAPQPAAHKRNMNFDFYQSISHFWCFQQRIFDGITQQMGMKRQIK